MNESVNEPVNEPVTGNLASLIDAHPAESVALISAGRTVTYGELRDAVSRVRGGLLAHGIGSGDRVALVLCNGRPFVEVYLAAVGLGAVVVPLNPFSPALELQRQAARVAPVAVVVDAVGMTNWKDVDAPSVRLTVTTASASTPAEQPGPGTVALADLRRAEPVGVAESAPIGGDDLAVLMFTSGTVGAPIPACLSHANLLANIEQSHSLPGALRAGDVVFGVIPLSHIFGLNVVLGAALSAGSTVLLVQRFDPYTAIESIVERGVTVLVGAPPMWLAFDQSAELAGEGTNPFATVRLAVTGAARMPEAATRSLAERFGIQLCEGYGLTEASPVVTSSIGQPWRPGSVGRPLPGVEVRLVEHDEHGHPLGDVEPGDTGEVWVRGANVFSGYLDEPEATARALTEDGWLRTGDIAMFGEDGSMYLVDRAKDLIIVSGFNVFPAEVEDAIAEHPEVAEVGVIGVPHPHSGEAVKAFVVLRRDAALDESGIVAWCEARLARYKCPNKVIFVDELPRTLGGKVLRRSLERSEAAGRE